MANRAEFVSIVGPIAAKLWEEGTGVLYPSIRLAQTLLETGGTIHAWNNIVGFKVGSGAPNEFWKGASVSTKTWEVYDGVRHDNVTANWRAYDCVEDCLRDQDRLFQNERYTQVRESTTPEDQAVALYRCGYATDPEYHKKLIAIAASYKEYDVERKPVTKGGSRILELKEDWKWTMLGDAIKELSLVGGGPLKDKQLVSYDWAEMAYKRELTVDDAIFVLTVALARSQGREVEAR